MALKEDLEAAVKKIFHDPGTAVTEESFPWLRIWGWEMMP